MKASPFADIKLSGPAKGPDQRLFEKNEPEGSRADKLQTSAPSRARALVSSPEGTPAPSPARVNIPALEQSSAEANEDGQERTHARTLVRDVGRHTHDLFRDQIRWLNHLKLELTERRGEPITGNAMVQLAVDMLRDDYARNGENSELIRILVKGQARTSTPQRLPDLATGEDAR